jgi:hypothetical protein
MQYVRMPSECLSIDSFDGVSLATAASPDPVIMIGVEATRRVCGCAHDFFFDLQIHQFTFWNPSHHH